MAKKISEKNICRIEQQEKHSKLACDGTWWQNAG